MIRKVFLLGIAFLFLCSGNAYAAAADRVTVTTVIDNASEYPEAARKTYQYEVNAFYSYKSSYNYINVPQVSATQSFSFVNGQKQNVLSGKMGTNHDWVLFFMPASQTVMTDNRLSLTRIEYVNGSVSSYTYDNNRRTTLPVTLFNYVTVKTRTPEVILHFSYNGEVQSTQTVFDPQLSCRKRIDSLSDGAENPDTARRGVNDYRLYLDAETAASVAPDYQRKNIIFVMDCSGSMAYDMAGKSTSRVSSQRITKLKNQAVSMINTLKADPDNRYSVIRFAGAGSHESEIRIRNAQADQAITAVKALTANGGTNYFSGLSLITECLEDGDDCENIVIFITDGEPTAVPESIMNGLSSGTSDEYPIALPYAVYEAQHLPKGRIKAFYSILISSNKGYGSALQTVSQAVITGGDKASVMVSSETELKNVMDALAMKLVKKASGITITDTLSRYASFLGNVKVTAQTEGENRILSEGSDYELSVNGNEVSAAILAVEPKTRYELSFDIGASPAAVSEYTGTGVYPDAGDPGTDYEGTGNLTSSGCPGFFSNENAEASLSWADGSAIYRYRRPVLQVVIPEGIETEIGAVKKVYNINTGAYMGVSEGEWTFELFSKNGEEETVIGTAVNDADGRVTFAGIPLPRLEDAAFYIREIPGTDPHIDYDTHVAPVTVHVEYDPAEGTLFVKDVTGGEGSVAEFVNMYHYAPALVDISAAKVLSGYALRNNKFQFVLSKSTGEFVEKVNNRADGSVDFSTLRFTVPGTYRFRIHENPAYSLDPHVTYDLTQKNAVVTVTDDGTGDLTGTVSYPDGNTFTNIFTMTPTDGVILGHVTLYGMALTDSMFEYELYDESGELLETAGNDVNGNIRFSEIHYTEVGEHIYTIRQKEPAAARRIENMEYDPEAEISVRMSVTDNGEGDLLSDAVYERERFINSYAIRTVMK